MEVNQELPDLAAGLDDAVTLVGPGGRIAVLAYHSLEDRMVKERFVGLSRQPELPGPAPVRRYATARAPSGCSRARATDAPRGGGQPAGRERAAARARAQGGRPVTITLPERTLPERDPARVGGPRRRADPTEIDLTVR